MRGFQLATAALLCLAGATGCTIRVNPYNTNFGGSPQERQRDNTFSAVSSCATARGYVVERTAGANLLRASVRGLGSLEFSTEGATLHLSIFASAANDPGQVGAQALRQHGQDLFNCAHANMPELVFAEPVLPPPQPAPILVAPMPPPQPMAQPMPMNEQPIVLSRYCNRLSQCLSEVRLQLCQPGDPHCSGQYQFHVGVSDVQCYNILVNLPFGLEQSRQQHPQMQVPSSCDLKGEAYQQSP